MIRETILGTGSSSSGQRATWLAAAVFASVAIGMSPAYAQTIITTTRGPVSDQMVPIPTPAQPGAITLSTGRLPGGTAPEVWHSQYGSVFARNVVVATLTPFLPDAATATGTAVIVAPGGGFRTLSMENEGLPAAGRSASREPCAAGR